MMTWYIIEVRTGRYTVDSLTLVLAIDYSRQYFFPSCKQIGLSVSNVQVTGYSTLVLSLLTETPQLHYVTHVSILSLANGLLMLY
jgi:hypothetical protein